MAIPQRKSVSGDGVSRDGVVMTGRIIIAALASGVFTFAAVAISQTWGEPEKDPLLAYMAAGFATLAVIGSAIIPSIVSSAALAGLPPRSHVQQNDDVRLSMIYGAFQTRNIVGGAMLEGASLFCLVAYMVTARQWLLAVVGVLLLLMLRFLPTYGKLDRFVESREQLSEIGGDNPSL